MGSLKLADNVGNIRETFFVNQCIDRCDVKLSEQGDFILDQHAIIEVGGRTKSFSQLKSTEKGYLALDDIEIGLGKKIPLYLFGFLY